MCLFTELNAPIAPGKTFAPSQSLEFLGITLDSVPMLALLPTDKLDRARTLLQTWRKRSSCQLKELLSLIGILQFACRVIAPGCTFLRRLIALTCGMKQPYHFVRLNAGSNKDLSMWELFLTHFNGISHVPESEQTPSPSLQLFTDAAGSIGFGFRLLGKSSFTLSILLVVSGVPSGQQNALCFSVTTSPSFRFWTERRQNALK